MLAFAVSAAAEIDFAGQLKPVFAEHCVRCHGKDGKVKGKVNLLSIRDVAIQDVVMTHIRRKVNDSIASKASASASADADALKVVTGTGIMTTIEDLFERLHLLVGSIKAGNQSLSLKNELSDVSYYLYKNGHINKRVYNGILNLTQ